MFVYVAPRFPPFEFDPPPPSLQWAVAIARADRAAEELAERLCSGAHGDRWAGEGAAETGQVGGEMFAR